MADDRLQQAYECYERATFVGDADASATGERILDSVEADLCLARGRLLHAGFIGDQLEDPRERELFARAVELFRELGDGRGEAEALFWLGTYHQVVRRDTETALPSFERSYELAVDAGDRMTMSYAARHLGFAALEANRIDAAREHLEESLRLRQELDHRPAVAAALVAIAEVDVESGDPVGAARRIDEAAAVAKDAGAERVLYWVDQARAELAARD